MRDDRARRQLARASWSPTLQGDTLHGLGGVDYAVELRVGGENGNRDLDQYAIKTLRVSPRIPEARTANSNPRLDHIDTAIDDAAPVALPLVRCAENPAPFPVAPGTKLRMTPIEPDGVREVYVVPTLDGKSQTFTESLTYQWVANAGGFSSGSTGGPARPVGQPGAAVHRLQGTRRGRSGRPDRCLGVDHPARRAARRAVVRGVPPRQPLSGPEQPPLPVQPLSALPQPPSHVAMASPLPAERILGPIGESTMEPAYHRGSSSDLEATVLELGRRALSGAAGHLAAFVFVELRMPGVDMLPRTIIAAVFLCFVALRFLGFYLAPRARWSGHLRLGLLAAGGIGANLVWGVKIVAVLIHTGASEQAVVMAFIVCGMATGGVASFAASRWIQRAALAVVLLPAVAFGLAGVVPASLAALHAMFFGYTLIQGDVAYRSFWGSVRAGELLRRHADRAHLAAVAADATTLQLRAELAHGAKMEVELRQAQKLEAIGRLAAGIAHEINTPVQYVSDSCRFFAEGVEELTGGLDDYRRIVTELAGGRIAAADAVAAAARVDDERDLAYLRANLASAAARALEGLGRVAKIVSATKEFAYAHVGGKSLADINQAIESTLIISNNETKYIADVETELGELPAVLCHRGELNQVILNIIVNAAHAIRDVVKDTGARGVIRIKTWADAGRIRIAISDTGTGMPAEILDKIYEPFFTTKPVGTGTGQGLAIARSVIVDKHGGTIDVSSQLGVGTTFTISLPIG